MNERMQINDAPCMERANTRDARWHRSPILRASSSGSQARSPDFARSSCSSATMLDGDTSSGHFPQEVISLVSYQGDPRELDTYQGHPRELEYYFNTYLASLSHTRIILRTSQHELIKE
ncbi:unnamed protein product [Amoebophrya sp. A25]|nr:unnamed protein product [Amoebophrya sp. A25]|eukprot:GSA25T00013130001.1